MKKLFIILILMLIFVGCNNKQSITFFKSLDENNENVSISSVKQIEERMFEITYKNNTSNKILTSESKRILKYENDWISDFKSKSNDNSETINAILIEIEPGQEYRYSAYIKDIYYPGKYLLEKEFETESKELIKSTIIFEISNWKF